MPNTSILNNPQRLARLLSSLNTYNSDRPLGPVEVSDEIQSLLVDLRNNKVDLVKRLPIKKDMVDAFLRLQKLPLQIRDVVVWGDSDIRRGEISFSAAQQLGKLRELPHILKVASAILDEQRSRPITKDEVKAIVRENSNDRTKSIDECITQVLNVTRPPTIEHFMFISGVDPSIVNQLRKRSHKMRLHVDDYAYSILSEKFPAKSIKKIKVYDDYIQLVMTDAGSANIATYSDTNNLLRKDVINHMLCSGDLYLEYQ